MSYVYTGPTAYEGLTDLISFIGSFVNTQLWFGLSVLQLMALTFIIHFVICLLLGGISPRSNFEKQPVVTNYNNNKEFKRDTEVIKSIVKEDN